MVESSSNQEISQNTGLIHQMSFVDWFAGICTIIAVSISSYQITKHLLHFHEPQIQL